MSESDEPTEPFEVQANQFSPETFFRTALETAEALYRHHNSYVRFSRQGDGPRPAAFRAWKRGLHQRVVYLLEEVTGSLIVSAEINGPFGKVESRRFFQLPSLRPQDEEEWISLENGIIDAFNWAIGYRRWEVILRQVLNRHSTREEVKPNQSWH